MSRRIASCAVGAVLTLATAGVLAQTAGIAGYWRTPSGAVISIAACGRTLCLTIAALSRGRHPATDIHDPDPRLRGRPLCGLRIGAGFTPIDARQASGGHLYDPKSGRTYSGSMRLAGNTLRLRGYIGLPIFGRTETWVRAAAPPPCPTHP
jgi:uncharacterized protein (DUF2147 family)